MTDLVYPPLEFLQCINPKKKAKKGKKYTNSGTVRMLQVYHC